MRSPTEQSSDHPIYQRRGDYSIDRGTNPFGGGNIGSASESIGKHVAGTYTIEHYINGNESIAKAVENGNKLRGFIQNITIEEDEKMASKLTLDFANPEFAVTKSRGATQRGLVKEGDEIVVQLGYGNDRTSNNNRFIIMRSIPNFPRDGMPTINFEGMDGRYHLISPDFIPKKRAENLIIAQSKGVGKAPSVWKNKKDHEIIDGIAYHHGFAIDIDTTKSRRTRVRKKDTSDWEFILQLAKYNNYTAWIDWSDQYKTWLIHFRKKEVKFVFGYEFEYARGEGGALLSFRPRKDMFGQTTDVRVLHFDRRVKKLHTIYGTQQNVPGLPPLPNDPDDATIVSGTLLKFETEGRVIEHYSMRPYKSKKDAESYARYILKERSSDFITAEGTVTGTENLRPRQVHYCRGVDIYSGTYYFSQVRQKIQGSGIFETDFVAYRIPPTSVEDLVKFGDVMITKGVQ